ncbi:MAG: hypothetical protein AAFY38_11635 [Pseudomonadota bacterium]
MTVKPNDVRMAYRLILGRLPSDTEVANTQKNFKSVNALRNSFLLSKEFEAAYSRMRTRPGEQSDPLLIHLHIPKTAGTSLARALEAEPRLQPMRIVHQNGIDQLASSPRAERLQIRYLRGHLVMGAGQMLDVPHRYLCLLRKPGPRIFSFFQFIQRTISHPEHDLVYKGGMSFGDYLEFTQTNLNHRIEVHNGQVRRLSGVFFPPKFGHEAELLRLALHHILAPNMMWGLVEHLDLLIRDLVKDGLLSDPNIEKSNVSPHSDRYEAAIAELTDRQRAIFGAYTAFDNQLYQMCETVLLGQHNVSTPSKQKRK